MEEFRKLETDWNNLIQRHRQYAPFVCHERVQIWLKYFLNGGNLFILLLYKGDELIAIAPFILKKEKFRGLVNVRKIELIGNAHFPARNFIQDSLDPEAKRLTLTSTLNYFEKQFNDWDIIELDSVPEEDPTFDVLSNKTVQTRFKSRQYFCYGDWYLDDINYSGDEYIKMRPKNTRLELKRRRKRLEELGHLEFQIGGDKHKLEHYLNLYQEVRNKSWKHPEGDIHFEREFRQLAAEKGWLRFGFLLLNDSPIAAQIRIVSNGVAYFIDTVHDSKYNQFGPGSILRAEFTKHLIDVDRVKEIDNLKGDEPYKKDWTPKRRERIGYLVFNNNVKGTFLSILMTKCLPIIEKNTYILLAKNYIVEHLAKRDKKIIR